MTDLSLLSKALRFSAEKHKLTRRKGSDTPYINHPIEVMELLATYASVVDIETLMAALMHDLIEDEEVTKEEITGVTTQGAADIVEEVTDDPTLSKSEQIEAQVLKSPHLSVRAALLKLADKTSNIRSVIETPPPWQRSTKLKYIKQAKKVVDALPELPPESAPLKSLFMETYERGVEMYKKRPKSEQASA